MRQRIGPSVTFIYEATGLYHRIEGEKILPLVTALVATIYSIPR
jgi:hypothetical protein